MKLIFQGRSLIALIFKQFAINKASLFIRILAILQVFTIRLPLSLRLFINNSINYYILTNIFLLIRRIKLTSILLRLTSC